jgi:hypothetical protein
MAIWGTFPTDESFEFHDDSYREGPTKITFLNCTTPITLFTIFMHARCSKSFVKDVMSNDKHEETKSSAK